MTAKKAHKRPGTILGLALITALTWPLAWLPLRLGLAVGSSLGKLIYKLGASRRRIAVANIEMIKENGFLPADLDAPSTAQRAFANLGCSAWEAIRFYHRGLKPFMKDCYFEEGREYFEEALAQSSKTGRGLLIVTGHMGSWEVMCQYASVALNFKLNIVGRVANQPLPDLLTNNLRTKIGNNFIPKDGGARDMLSVLKKGGVLGTLIDQAVIGDTAGVPVPFMGRLATTNLGPMRLARRSRAAILMVLFRREGRRHFIKVMPPLETPPEGAEGDDALLADARQLNDWLGEHIRQYPDQWMWGHRRWKTRENVAHDAESII